VAILGVTMLLLFGWGGIGWMRSSTDLGPAGPSTDLRLPDRIFTPSRWLPGTDSTGPLGPLAAVMQTDRGGWLGTTQGVAGISAATGAYAFLDLPDLAQHAWAHPSLSPDGRHVAYWVTGPTTDTPNRQAGEPIAGVGVYDPTTGETRTWRTSTDHGLWPRDLAWADAGHLVITFNQFMGGEGDSDMAQSSGAHAPLQVWDLTQAQPASIPGMRGTTLYGVPGGGWIPVSGEGRWGFRMIDVVGDSGERQFTVSADMSSGGGASISPDGRRIAAVYGSRNPNHIGIAVVPHGLRGIALEPVSQDRNSWTVLGWLDETHVISRVAVEQPDSWLAAVARTDIETGKSINLCTLPEHSGGGNVFVAVELLGGPSRPAVAPPTPLDPRILTAGTLLVIAAGGWLLWKWRRRAPA